MNSKKNDSKDDRDFEDRIRQSSFGSVVNYEDLAPEDKRSADRDLAYYESVKGFLTSFGD